MSNPRPISETELRFVKPFIRWFTQCHIFLFKSSGGQFFNRFGGGDVCLVKMKGAKSGQTREFPLMHVPYKDGIVLVASLAGAPRHPVWYHNLVAHPEIEVLAHGTTRHYVARLASTEEKADIWPVCDAVYADFALYRQRTERDIPIFICAPPAA